MGSFSSATGAVTLGMMLLGQRIFKVCMHAHVHVPRMCHSFHLLTHYLTHQLTTLLTNSLPYSLALLTHSRSGAGASRRLSLRRCSSPPAPPSSASPSSARRSSLGSRTVGPCTFSGLATPSYLLGCAGLHTHALRCLAPPASHRSRPLLRRWAPRPSCSPSSSARRRASNPTPTPTPTPTLTLT
jgi:hypothetical protein